MYNNISIILKILTLLMIVAFTTLGYKSTNPEDLILGHWNETDWAYEKIENKSILDYDISSLKKHEAEKWRFKKDKKVEFIRNDELVAEAKWTLKGRGHILKLDYADGSQEIYDIKKLNDNEMVLNFDIGMETRGIARLRFKK